MQKYIVKIESLRTNSIDLTYAIDEYIESPTEDYSIKVVNQAQVYNGLIPVNTITELLQGGIRENPEATHIHVDIEDDTYIFDFIKLGVKEEGTEEPTQQELIQMEIDALNSKIKDLERTKAILNGDTSEDDDLPF
jgi:hypothetical protein